MIPLLWKKAKRNKEPFDEGKREEWKSWLKTQHSENEDHGIWSHHFVANRRGKSGNSERFYFLGLQNHGRRWLQLHGRKAMTNLDSILKSRDITLLTKVHTVKAVFPVVMYGCESWTIEGWLPKNQCFWTVVLEKTLLSRMDSKESKPVNPKGDQPWIFTGRTEAEAETPTLRSPDEKSSLTGKDPDAGKDWRQECGATKEEMVGWHHQLSWREYEQTPGNSGRQKRLVCCRPWGHKELDKTYQLNNNNNKFWSLSLTKQFLPLLSHILKWLQKWTAKK